MNQDTENALHAGIHKWREGLGRRESFGRKLKPMRVPMRVREIFDSTTQPLLSC